jgi:glucose/arabinose dehydrogenase
LSRGVRGRRGAALLLAVLGPLILSAAAGAVGPYGLLVSKSNNRSAPAVLDGSSVSGNIYVFTSPDTADVSRVRFWLDNPSMTGTPRRTESAAPYDFNGGNVTTATAFNTTTLPDGAHTITAAVDLTSGTTEVVHANFTVANNAPPPPSLSFSPSSFSFSVQSGDPAPADKTSDLTASDSSAVAFTLNESASWLTVSAGSAQTPSTITASVDPAGLAPGTYTAPVTAAATGYLTATLNVSFTVTPVGGDDCVPLTCSEILVDYPYSLGWSIDHGKIVDKDGAGTGFTYVDDPTNGTGYIPANLDASTASPGTLKITTTKGLNFNTVNSQDNMLGIGIDSAGKTAILQTTLLNPPAGSMQYQQAGLWYGIDEDSHDKLVFLSTSAGTKIQHLLEVNGATSTSRSTAVIANLSTSTVRLRLTANAGTREITAAYSVNGAAFQNLGAFTAPGEFFNADAAGIDPRIGTRTFGGIFASHRNGPSALTYTFDDFSLTEGAAPPPPPPPPPPPGGGGVSFQRISIPGDDGVGGTPNINNPTALAWGPDDRLYVADMLGTIQALTLNANKQVTNRQVITTLGNRLTLGLTIDPASTPTNVILWVTHSHPDLTNNAPANSSVVSRLSGPNLATKTDVIIGLPRSAANHSLNSLHFGPDGRLYIASGGNTGAGSANTAGTEFKDRPEQPLSAALLVADVKAAGFQGSCATPIGQSTIPSTCDARTDITGLRNMYDFVFHSNGSVYGPDNGLGVRGSYPPERSAPCKSLGSVAPWDQGGNNPGDQPDILNRLVAGRYYGHPNPYRATGGECVFKDGTLYPDPKPAPLANYTRPVLVLGPNKSSDGIIEYRSDVFGGSLQGELLITNYAAGDNITRVKLAPGGLTVTNSSTLAVPRVAGETKDFQNPLPIVEGPDGTVYVGEHAVGRVAALKPVPSGAAGTWTTKAPVPTAILDAGGAALGGKLFTVAGKTSGGYLKTLRIYDPASNSWSTGPSLPAAYPAVENPAVVAFDGKLYVFGGSTAAFSGAVTNAAVFDPATNAWTNLAAMPVGRGGPTAQALGGKIYVAGGLDSAGTSLATVSVYNPATNTWSAAAPMATPRDNPGSAILADTDGNQKLYVFGGRSRNVPPSDGTLSSVEMYNPATNTWTARAAMPTGRRTMAVGLLNGRAQLMGGENSGTAPGTFPQNEEYNPLTNSWSVLTSMPTPRHGAAYGTIGSFVYVAAGGPNSGTSFTTVNEAFRLG